MNEQLLDALADTVLKMYKNGWHRKLVLDQADKVHAIRHKQFPSISCRDPERICTSEVHVECRLMCWEYPQLRSAYDFFVSRDRGCKEGPEFQQCVVHRREISRLMTLAREESERKIAQWTEEYSELDEDWSKVCELLGLIRLEEGLFELRDAVHTPAGFMKLVVFAQCRKIDQLEHRIKELASHKRKAEEVEEESSAVVKKNVMIAVDNEITLNEH